MLGRMILAGLVFLMYVRLIFLGSMLLWIGVESRFSPALFWNSVSATADHLRLSLDQTLAGYDASLQDAWHNRLAPAKKQTDMPAIGIAY